MIVTGDFETYYDQEYSLNKMSEVEYILDPRFQTIMLGLKLGFGPTKTYVGHDAVADQLATLDWDNIAWLSHHTRFDGSILAWKFGHRPKLYLDTLSMARATTHWQIGRSSLAAVSKYLDLPDKGDAVVRAKGKRLEDFRFDELSEYQTYCVRDNDNCREIFDRLRPWFSASELALIDIVLRMFIEPQIRLNAQVLQHHLAQVQAEKARVLAEVGEIPKTVFSSNQQFAMLLESYGVEVPIKVSPTTGEVIPALARHDPAFKELCADETQPLLVQALLAARLSVKSTLEETRTMRLLKQAQVGGGWAPVPLKYSGARTHRLSGDGGVNWQNPPRGSLIREAIEAPPGMRVVHRDASQIEARMVAWLARCMALLDAFRDKRDVYCEFATIIYRRLITPSDKLERFVGKTSILGLGYGCGGERFRVMLFIGNGGISIKVTSERAQEIVYLYRNTYPEIRSLWETFEMVLRQLAIGNMSKHDRMRFSERVISLSQLPIEFGIDGLWLPNGLCISYPRLHAEHNAQRYETEMFYKAPLGDSQIKIYGAKCLENVSQALARIIVTDIAVRVRRETGYVPFLTTHDSLDYCVPERDAEAMDAHLNYEFSIIPPWATGLPLASEGGWGKTLRAAERMTND